MSAVSITTRFFPFGQYDRSLAVMCGAHTDRAVQLPGADTSRGVALYRESKIVPCRAQRRPQRAKRTVAAFSACLSQSRAVPGARPFRAPGCVRNLGSKFGLGFGARFRVSLDWTWKKKASPSDVLFPRELFVLMIHFATFQMRIHLR